MPNGVNAADSNPPATFSESQERSIVWLLCLLAAVSRFLFFRRRPRFFNNVDEQIHLDLAVKYSQGHIPRSLEAGIPRGGALRHIVRLAGVCGNSDQFPRRTISTATVDAAPGKSRPALVAKNGGVAGSDEL